MGSFSFLLSLLRKKLNRSRWGDSGAPESISNQMGQTVPFRELQLSSLTHLPSVRASCLLNHLTGYQKPNEARRHKIEEQYDTNTGSNIKLFIERPFIKPVFCSYNKISMSGKSRETEVSLVTEGFKSKMGNSLTWLGLAASIGRYVTSRWTHVLG